MAIGMTYEQYWYGDVHMARAFYEADRLRQKRMNDEAWLYGAYVYRALDAIVGNAFRRKGMKQAEYPPEPVWKEEREEKRETEDFSEAEVLYAKAYMTNMLLAGQSWEKKQ